MFFIYIMLIMSLKFTSNVTKIFMNIFIYCIPVQLSAVTPDDEPEPLLQETPLLAETPFRPVGRFGVRPSTSTPAIYPRPLSFMDELAQKQREMGRTVDRPANFGCRPVEEPRVSLLIFFYYSTAGSDYNFYQVDNFDNFVGRKRLGPPGCPTGTGSGTGG
jgi:hypothetical protein